MWNTYRINVTLISGLAFSKEFEVEVGTSSHMTLVKGLHEIELATSPSLFSLDNIKDVDVKYVEED